MSSLKIFADQCVPATIVASLRRAGIEVLILKDHIPPTSSDSEVIAKAQDLGAILLSLNGDFADIVTYPPKRYQGIIGLQLKNHPEIIPSVVQRLAAYLSANPDPDHYLGKLLLVDPSRIRTRS